jgi:hypothetical protein
VKGFAGNGAVKNERPCPIYVKPLRVMATNAVVYLFILKQTYLGTACLKREINKGKTYTVHEDSFNRGYGIYSTTFTAGFAGTGT